MQRTFDFDIETSNGSTHTFNSIDKSEYNGFLEFIKSKKYVLSSGESMARQEDWSSTDESHDGYLERMKEEGKRSRAKEAKVVLQDDDDDDEDDADFNPEEVGESDVAEEYDSEVDTSTSSSDESNGNAASTKPGTAGGGEGASSADNSGDERPAKTKESIKKQVIKTKVEKSVSERKPVSEKKTEKKSSSDKKQSSMTDTTKKTKKKTKDPNAPKKPLTAFLLFSNEVRDEVKKSLPTGSTIGDVAKVIGERWKSVTDSEKTKYGNIYKAEHLKYQEAMKKYEKSGSAAASGSGVQKSSAERATPKSQKVGEIVGKLSAGVYKSEEFVESSDTSD